MYIHVVFGVHVGMRTLVHQAGTTLRRDSASRGRKLHPVGRGLPTVLLREGRVVIGLVVHDVKVAHLIVSIGPEKEVRKTKTTGQAGAGREKEEMEKKVREGGGSE